MCGLAAYLLEHLGLLSSRGQACFGVVCILGLIAMFSSNLRALSWRTLIGGFTLQWLLALFTLKFAIYGGEAVGIPEGFRPGYEFFHAIADGIKKFLFFTEKGAGFVFGPLATHEHGFVFAFASTGLPVIIFVSSFFTMLYYLGVLQMVVRFFARAMVVLMGTSGAESLTSAANVFMGQTEAPLIIKPYIAKMTQSELFSMMVAGMTHISGALMAVYIGFGADQVAILSTCVMAAPGGLYLSKLFMPETETPETRGVIRTEIGSTHCNVIDAAASGASEGMFLAINVAAMLIAFLALVALIDYMLGLFPVGESLATLLSPAQGWAMVGNAILTLVGYYVFCLGLGKLWRMTPMLQNFTLNDRVWTVRVVAYLLGYVVFLALLEGCLRATDQTLSLKAIFSRLFAPLAFLMGVQGMEIYDMANLLGTKLALNEFVAYQELKEMSYISPRTRILATYALTGFANFGSIAIQLGGIGAMAPHRRPDLARFGLRRALRRVPGDDPQRVDRGDSD